MKFLNNSIIVFLLRFYSAAKKKRVYTLFYIKYILVLPISLGDGTLVSPNQIKPTK